MRMKYANWAMTLVLAGFANAACYQQTETSESQGESVGQLGQAMVGQDEFLYLRCNATGWDANAATLLAQGATADEFVLDYTVDQAWMVSNSDQCVITRTNSETGWGSQATHFGAASSSILTAPGSWAVGAQDSSPFQIKYPGLGQYRATIDWAERTLSVEEVSSVPPAYAYHYYLMCNATSWNVDDNSRLVDDGSGLLGLQVEVTQGWIASSGDQCIVRRTDALNGWGTSQANLGAASSTALSVPASEVLAEDGAYFAVQYPEVGTYSASFDPTTGELTIETRTEDPQDPPIEANLHGAVEYLDAGKIRVTYDFEDPAHLLDFVAADAAATAVSIVDGRLVVEPLVSGISVATLVEPLRVDHISYQSELLEGSHINAYVGTIWDNSWLPDQGYGAVLRSTGRFFTINGQSVDTPDDTPIQLGTVYQASIDASTTGFDWTLDGATESVAAPYYGGTLRSLFLGGYASTVAFDNLVIEGQLNHMVPEVVDDADGEIQGAVEALGDGRVRITYDFESAEQQLDWFPSDPTIITEILDGRLVVSRLAGHTGSGVALLEHPLRVDSMNYEAELLLGAHVNAYFATAWDGSWAPSRGCGVIHRNDGRLFVNDGTSYISLDSTPISERLLYTGSIQSGSTGVDWVVNGTSVILDVPCYDGTDSTVGVGAYESDVAFDNIVIEGLLAEM